MEQLRWTMIRCTGMICGTMLFCTGVMEENTAFVLAGLLAAVLPLVWKRVRKELGPAAGNFYREHMREKQTPADESDETEKN